ncbi:MAG: hypothetical protein HYU25_02920 [Candidatus Rokubacteria bacterium]|nr:hypothetical protein [Candidatus Rokubacteria bacterium]
MAERVTVSVDDGVADVQLNRPEKLNGPDLAMFEALGPGPAEPARGRAGQHGQAPAEVQRPA